MKIPNRARENVHEKENSNSPIYIINKEFFRNYTNSVKSNGSVLYFSGNSMRRRSINLCMEVLELGLVYAKEVGEIPQTAGFQWEFLQISAWRLERNHDVGERITVQAHQFLR